MGLLLPPDVLGEPLAPPINTEPKPTKPTAEMAQ